MDSSLWNQRFAGETYFYGTEPNAFVVACAPRIPPGPVLCLGEGEGRNAAYLAARGHPVTAIDQSAVGLAKAARLAASRGTSLDTIAADLADFVITPGTWSAIVAIFVHLPPALRTLVHRRAAAGLCPGGLLILEAYTPAQLAYATGGPKDPTLLMTLDLLRSDFAGLDLLVAHEIERDVVEGPGHTGRAAVVQVLARHL